MAELPTVRSEARGAEGLLDGLTAAQRAAVVSEATPLCIVAAAGAGKTRVLTRRIAFRCRTGTADAGHTLALTFTRKAAGELQHRLGGLGLRGGVAAGTFHSHAAAQLQRWWADRRSAPPALLERKSRLLGPIVASRAAASSVPLSEVAGLIEWAKARTVSPEELEGALEAARRPLPQGVSPTALAAIYARYEHEKRRRGLVDFDDLLSRCADAIETDPEFAGAQRWRWRHVYVDEFQDLNPLQHRLLLAWLGTSTDLCVVGDPNQAIYGWNGADPGLLASFTSRWPGAEVLRLDANHRSTDQIVRAAAAVLGPGGERLSGVDRQGLPPVVRGFESDRAEAGGVAAALVAAHRDGRPWSAMAVLTRTNAQLVAMQDALSAAGVPWWSAASAALLDDPSVRDFLAGQRAAIRAGMVRPLRTALADLEEMIAEADPRRPGSEEAVAALTALLETGTGLAASRPEASVADWLAWLPTTVKDRSDRTGSTDTVTLSSFHRAKGLEWNLVWVAGVEEGLVPMGRSSGPALEEERRLLYVALTRAVEELHVSWSETRSFGARPVRRQPSRWLEAVAAAAEEAERALSGRVGVGAGGWCRVRVRGWCRGRRERLAGPPDGTEGGSPGVGCPGRAAAGAADTVALAGGGRPDTGSPAGLAPGGGPGQRGAAPGPAARRHGGGPRRPAPGHCGGVVVDTRVRGGQGRSLRAGAARHRRRPGPQRLTGRSADRGFSAAPKGSTLASRERVVLDRGV
ncbi:MAG TPA: ATP-dependent helicase [Acidimicrobiales bacterium]|nr:ATP-dependent helicase [Acidimicrobiales bacterium]